MNEQIIDDDFRELVLKILKYDIDFMKKFNHDKLDSENEKEYWKHVAELYPIAVDAKMLLNEIVLKLGENENILYSKKDDPIYDFIKDLRDGKKMQTIIFYDIFEGYSFPGKKEVEDDYHSEWQDECKNALFDRIIPECYVNDRIKLLPIIKMRKIPVNFSAYFGQIIDSYAFGIPLGYTALCRALLEICISDLLKSNKEYNIYLKENYGKVPCFSDRIDLAYDYKILNSDMKDLAHQIRLDANRVLHISNKKSCNKYYW